MSPSFFNTRRRANDEPYLEKNGVLTDAANVYAAWEPTFDAVLDSAAPILLLGGMDVGKTTFTRLLVNRAVAAGRRVALLDGDPGQSEIGPPGCVGLALTASPVAALSDLSPLALAFVGGTSPAAHLLEHASGVRRLADLAADALLIVDTCGYIQSGGGRRMQQTEFDLLQPGHVIALQRGTELEPILAPMRRRTHCRVHTPPVPEVIARKTPALRTQRRAMRFAAYFANSALHTYRFEDVAFVGTWLGGSEALPPHLLKFVNQSLWPPARVYHAELCDRHLGLMVSLPLEPNLPGLGVVQEQMKALSLTVTVAPRLKHLLLGLESGSGKLLGLGLLEALDFRRRTLGVLTPIRAPDAAQIVRFGTLRVTAEGQELGSLRPTEL